MTEKEDNELIRGLKDAVMSHDEVPDELYAAGFVSEAEAQEKTPEEELRENPLLKLISGTRLKPMRRNEPRIGRNEPCPCKSGKKYKKCCLQKKASEPCFDRP